MRYTFVICDFALSKFPIPRAHVTKDTLAMQFRIEKTVPTTAGGFLPS